MPKAEDTVSLQHMLDSTDKAMEFAGVVYLLI